jgi:hypothetical protein
MGFAHAAVRRSFGAATHLCSEAGVAKQFAPDRDLDVLADNGREQIGFSGNRIGTFQHDRHDFISAERGMRLSCGDLAADLSQIFYCLYHEGFLCQFCR